MRKKATVRRRPPRAQRQTNQLAMVPFRGSQQEVKREGKQEVGARKRKKTELGTESGSLYKVQCLPVIPNEGSPSSQ